MGHYSSDSPTLRVAQMSATVPWLQTKGRALPFGQMQYRVFTTTTTFTIPALTTMLRVTCRSQGATDAIPGATCSFSDLLSCTGGSIPNGVTGGAGGVALGGQIRNNGGNGGNGASDGSSKRGGGGGQSGNPFAAGIPGNNATTNAGGVGGGFAVDPSDALLILAPTYMYARWVMESFFPGTPYNGAAVSGSQSGTAGGTANWGSGTGGEWRNASGSGIMVPATPIAGGGKGGTDGKGGGGGGAYAQGVFRVDPGTAFTIVATPEAPVVLEW